ncbi:MAG: UbiA family prenyltransferase [Desulfomonilaceae bacterium]
MSIVHQTSHGEFAKLFSNFKLFLGLSRTPHGLLDVATPAMAAMLQLGQFPPASTIVIGLIAAFSGYTAVYAMNDLVDVTVDRERLALKKKSDVVFHVDEVLVEHPVAQGLIPFKRGLEWVIFWTSLALIGAAALNPLCAVIFAISACCEVIYCKLLKVTHWKIIPSAFVKATGGLAGIYAVNPAPNLSFVVFMFLWLACWEVGGQNIANDIVDMEDDGRVGARTMLTVLGLRESLFILLVAASMATFAGVTIFLLAGPGLGRIYPIGAAVLGYFLLLKPAKLVYESPGPRMAASLFNRASYMPLSFLALIVVSVWIKI